MGLPENNQTLNEIKEKVDDMIDVVEGLPSGDDCTATASDILYGKTAISADGVITGSLDITSYSNTTNSLTTNVTAPPDTAYDSIQITASDQNLLPENIRDGVQIFGVTGIYGRFY